MYSTATAVLPRGGGASGVNSTSYVGGGGGGGGVGTTVSIISPGQDTQDILPEAVLAPARPLDEVVQKLRENRTAHLDIEQEELKVAVPKPTIPTLDI